MPIFRLDKQIIFPPVEFAEESGILAIDGDLSPARLIEAYRNGIFPWYSDDDPIIWWSPDPRFVLFPDEIYISKTMRQVLKRKTFSITYDTCFTDVISECRNPRKDDDGTWITDEMIDAYSRLHDMGVAHSVEAWKDGTLAGGLYGISLGGCFFGESMFTKESNASKAALITLACKLKELNFSLIDCQVFTEHLKSMGAREIPRSDFIAKINESLNQRTLTGNWCSFPEFSD